jgi:hypothetical protein
MNSILMEAVNHKKAIEKQQETLQIWSMKRCKKIILPSESENRTPEEHFKKSTTMPMKDGSLFFRQ